MKEKSKLSLQQSILWNTTGNIFYLFTQWVLSIIIVWMEGFSISGIFAIAMSLSNVFCSIALYGMRNFQISDVHDEYSFPDYLNSRYLSMIVSILLCIVFVLFNGGIYGFEKSLVIIAYTLFRMSEALFDVYSGMFQKKWRVDLIGKSLILRGIFNTAIFITTLYFTHNLLLAIIFMTLGAYGSLFIFDIRKSKTFVTQKNSKSQNVFHLLKKCFPLLIYTLVLTIIGTVPRYFLDYYFEENLVGIYNSIATLTIIVQTIATQIFNPFLSIFSEAIKNDNKAFFFSTLKKCFSLLLILSIIAIGGSVLLGRPVLGLLYGEKILPYVGLLLPLIIATIINSYAWLLSSLLTIYQSFTKLLIINIIGLAICVLASPLFISTLGLQGATYAMILPAFIQSILLTFIFLKLHKSSFNV